MDIWRCNVWWIWRMNQNFSNCNSFCLVIKETCGLPLCWWKIMHFTLTNSGCFLLSGVFSWSNWGHLGINHLVFWKEFPSNPIVYATSPSLYEEQSLVWFMVIHFTCPMVSSVPHYVQYPQYSLPITICFKNETFSLHFSRESHAKIWSRRFFHLTYVEHKHQRN